MKKQILVLVLVAFALLTTSCKKDEPAATTPVVTTGTISGVLTFKDASTAALVATNLTYKVVVMTMTQYSNWSTANNASSTDAYIPTTSYETTSKTGTFTSSAADNTADYTITSVPAGTYVVIALAWVNTTTTNKYDHAGMGNLYSNTSTTVTASQTTTVSLDVSPAP
ncbi:MAG: hypothetical protein A2Y41_09805 [Spirochaetes bacterium GWB1_36_13]|nr:MAG: hypothetical protein A2Y41_09805 [Spirochaetes bacterium GWB1_36_13]